MKKRKNINCDMIVNIEERIFCSLYCARLFAVKTILSSILTNPKSIYSIIYQSLPSTLGNFLSKHFAQSSPYSVSYNVASSPHSSQ